MTSLSVGPGTHILIYGASGAIGSAGVQLAKDRGAAVTAAVETRHLDLARPPGADHVVDCASGELARLTRRFDIVYDAVGKMTTYRPDQIADAYRYVETGQKAGIVVILVSN